MRARTALAAGVALAPVLLAAPVAGVVLQRAELTDATALIAEDHARTAARAAVGSPDAATTGTPALGGESSLVQVVDQDEGVVSSSPALEGRAALLPAPDGSAVDQRRLSGLVEGEAVAAGDTYVIAAQSLESVDAATSSTTRLLAVGGPSLVLVVAGLGWLLAGRALRPVEDLRVRASEVSAADPTARLPLPGTGDEIQRLCATLNAMLERLSRSAESQRQLVADASHELRSPIATVRTLHEVAAAETDPDWALISEETLAEATRLERLVDDLLLLARADAAGPLPSETVPLTEIVHREASRARALPVAHALAPGVIVTGHAESLARAARNLLDNAERHGRQSVRVDL